MRVPGVHQYCLEVGAVVKRGIRNIAYVFAYKYKTGVFVAAQREGAHGGHGLFFVRVAAVIHYVSHRKHGAVFFGGVFGKPVAVIRFFVAVNVLGQRADAQRHRGAHERRQNQYKNRFLNGRLAEKAFAGRIADHGIRRRGKKRVVQQRGIGLRIVFFHIRFLRG